jgi:glycosyltransferase involved in cell wall biosynthesis
VNWTSIQLGSREHYAVPSALDSAGKLDCLITDTWLSSGAAALVRPFHSSLAGRRHERLSDSKVRSNTAGRLLTDLRLRRQRKSSWSTILERNAWFGAWAAEQSAKAGSPVVFSYSYTAKLPFAEAKRRGALCILGQIDPGPREEEVVAEQTAAYRHLAPPDEKAPAQYWQLWRQEIDLADKIIVNSPWSAKLLKEAGVPTAKLVEVPLVYERAESSVGSMQSSEEAGSMEHGARSMEKRSNTRLQALFLGSVILRKGVGQLFDAIRMLKNEPVDFTFAGPIGVKIPGEISQLPNVRFLGPVDKVRAERLYCDSDVFLFPTLSDGFGITQLEALGHSLPVIVSTHCGQVVEHGVTGLLLAEVTPDAVAETTMALVRDRDLLALLKSGARMPDKFHPRHLAPALLRLVSGAV